MTASGRPREFDVEKALRRAMQVFWRKGYIGASLSDLTEAMRINRPSLYAAFGNKEALFRKVLALYFKEPSAYAHESLQTPTARAVVEHLLYGAINMLTGPKSPSTCMWVNCALSSGGGRLRKEFASQRSEGHELLRKRLQRAIDEGELPITADANELARKLADALAEKLRATSLEIYKRGVQHAATRGIIIADTKFEFGTIGDELIWIDEALTPDSSRFWPADQYEPGKAQPSFDKQYVRDYLEQIGWNKQPPGPALPDEVVKKTTEKYREAYQRVTGNPLD